jgi:hypothetical protein
VTAADGENIPKDSQGVLSRTYGAVIHEVIYMRDAGIYSKDITLDPLQHLGMTIRLDGRVAA